MRKKFMINFEPGEICKSVELDSDMKLLPNFPNKAYRSRSSTPFKTFCSIPSNDISKDILFVITLFFLANTSGCIY